MPLYQAAVLLWAFTDVARDTGHFGAVQRAAAGNELSRPPLFVGEGRFPLLSGGKLCYTEKYVHDNGLKGGGAVERVILHCDLNGFYASVELLSLPHLRDVPMAVCGDPTSRHGIVLAKNEKAKAFGVKTAETIWQAKRKCPELVCVPPHHRRYADYSRLVNEIYGRYTDLVEPFGIDESWLDITGSVHLFGGDPVAVADEIRAVVKRELGLTVSVGVSFNKIFAKLGSDYKKPDATTLISPENWREIVWPLPVTDLLFVGRAADRVLEQYGVRTIGQLAAADPALLEALLGKQGRQLHQYANGLEHSPVRPQHEREPVKSVGNSTTFPQNLTTWPQVRTGLSLLCDSVAARLRQQGLYCSGVQVGIKYADFRTVSRQKQLVRSTHLMKELLEAAVQLTEDIWRPPEPIRLLNVTAISLTDEQETYEQADLFAGAETAASGRQEKLERAIDAIRGRFGDGAIAYGAAAAGTPGPEDAGSSGNSI